MGPLKIKISSEKIDQEGLGFRIKSKTLEPSVVHVVLISIVSAGVVKMHQRTSLIEHLLHSAVNDSANVSGCKARRHSLRKGRLLKHYAVSIETEVLSLSRQCVFV